MSFKNYENAVLMAQSINDYIDAGENDDVLMEEIEERLGYSLSKQNYDYWKKFGFMMFANEVVYGIGKGTFTGNPGYNSVNTLLFERENTSLPKEWVPIYNFSDGYMAYLDYKYLNNQGEHRVIMAIFTGSYYEIEKVLVEDFGDFLLSLVEQVCQK